MSTESKPLPKDRLREYLESVAQTGVDSAVHDTDVSKHDTQLVFQAMLAQHDAMLRRQRARYRYCEACEAPVLDGWTACRVCTEDSAIAVLDDGRVPEEEK